MILKMKKNKGKNTTCYSLYRAQEHIERGLTSYSIFSFPCFQTVVCVHEFVYVHILPVSGC